MLEVRKTYADAANRGLRRSPARAGALPRLIARLSARARFAVLGFGSNGSWPRRVGVAAAAEGSPSDSSSDDHRHTVLPRLGEASGTCVSIGVSIHGVPGRVRPYVRICRKLMAVSGLSCLGEVSETQFKLFRILWRAHEADPRRSLRRRAPWE